MQTKVIDSYADLLDWQSARLKELEKRNEHRSQIRWRQPTNFPCLAVWSYVPINMAFTQRLDYKFVEPKNNIHDWKVI